MKLAEYLKKNRITQLEFSKRVGVSPALINYITKQKQNPSAALIKRIEQATNREVTLDDLYNEKIPSKLVKEFRG